VVTVLAGIPGVAIPGGQDYVHHLAGGDEMNAVPATCPRLVRQFLEESPHGRPEHGLIVPGVHPVAMKLDEEPLGAISHGDRQTPPQTEPPHRRGIARRQRPVLDAWRRPPVRPPSEA